MCDFTLGSSWTVTYEDFNKCTPDECGELIVINEIIDSLIPCLSNLLGSNDLFKGSMKRRSTKGQAR